MNKPKPSEKPPTSKESDKPPVEPVKQPEFATKDEMNSIQGAMQNLTTEIGKMGARVEGFLAGGSRSNEPTQPLDKPTSVRTVTEADIKKAFEDGETVKAAELQIKYNDESIKEMEQKFSTNLTAVQNQGMSLIGDLARGQVSKELPYYNRFKDEIEDFISKVSPEARMSPKVYEFAHNAVLGKHMKELVNEEVEAEIRKRTEGEGGQQPGSDTGRSGGEGKLTVESVYGDKAKEVRALVKSRGMTMEQYARRQGYEDEQKYLEHAKKHFEEEEGTAVNE